MQGHSTQPSSGYLCNGQKRTICSDKISKLLLATVLSLSITGQTLAQDALTFVEFIVNNKSQETALILLRKDDILVRLKDLQKVGLKEIHGTPETVRGESFVSLKSLGQDVTYKFDSDNLQLSLTAQPKLFQTNVFNLEPNSRPPNIVNGKDKSAYLNYALNTSNLNLAQSTISLEGVYSLGQASFYTNVNRNSDGRVVRGLSNLIIDNPKMLTRFTLGDTYAFTGDLGGGLLLGGISYSREFGIDPYLVTTPTFNLTGAVLSPSTVEVLVNGQRMQIENLNPGPFQINNLAVPTGLGMTQLIIRDAFGNERMVNYPYSLAQNLLSPGLSEFSINLGFERTNLREDSFNYGKLAFLGRYRRGLTRNITAGARMEANPDLVSGGVNLSAAVPFGAIQVAGAASEARGKSGAALLLGYSHSGRKVSFGGGVLLQSPYYATLGLDPEDDRTLQEINTFLSFPVAKRANVGIRASYSNFRDNGSALRANLLATINITPKATLVLSAGRSQFADQKPSNEVALSLNYNLGGRRSANAGVGVRNQKPYGIVGIQQGNNFGTGLAYNLQFGNDFNGSQAFGRVSYGAPFGLYEVSFSEVNSETLNFNSTIAGGLVSVGNRFFATRPISQSFAIIKVPGVKGVSVSQNNQIIGHTDKRGDVFVTDLLPYYGNQISIKDTDIPINYGVSTTEQLIAPPYRGGSVVSFPVQRIQSLFGSVILVVDNQEIIPAYGNLNIMVDGKEQTSAIGNKGEFYFENLPPGKYPAEIDYTKGLCKFELIVPESQQNFLRLGQLRCALSPLSPPAKP